MDMINLEPHLNPFTVKALPDFLKVIRLELFRLHQDLNFSTAGTTTPRRSSAQSPFIDMENQLNFRTNVRLNRRGSLDQILHKMVNLKLDQDLNQQILNGGTS